MADESPNGSDTPPDLVHLANRLAESGADPADRTQPRPRGAAFGGALKVSSEMIAGIAVGGGAGWLLDDWLDTSPALLLVCVVLGFAAGLRNVFRTVHRLGASDQDRNSKTHKPDRPSSRT